MTLPEFYKECIVTWTLLNEDNPSTSSEIANQVIWNNQFICIESKSIFLDRLIDLGLLRIGDLYDTCHTGSVQVQHGTIKFNSLTS